MTHDDLITSFGNNARKNENTGIAYLLTYRKIDCDQNALPMSVNNVTRTEKVNIYTNL